MNQQGISHRRRSLMLGAAAAGAAALTHPLSVLAQAADEIVIGGSIPMTGVFAFAGVGINAGIEDYVKIVNEAGGKCNAFMENDGLLRGNPVLVSNPDIWDQIARHAGLLPARAIEKAAAV